MIQEKAPLLVSEEGTEKKRSPLKIGLGLGLLGLLLLALLAFVGVFKKQTVTNNDEFFRTESGNEFDLFGVSRYQRIYNYIGYRWYYIRGVARFCSVGYDGTVWVLQSSGAIYQANVNTIKRRRVASPDDSDDYSAGWRRIPGSLRNAAVATRTNIWGINRYDMIFNWNGHHWRRCPGRLRSISVGSDGTVWGVNAGDIIFHRLNSGIRGNFGTGWRSKPGRLLRVSVASANLIVGVSRYRRIYRWDGDENGWTRIPGLAISISINTEGMVVVVTPYGYIYVTHIRTILPANPHEDESAETHYVGWRRIPGRLSQVVIYELNHGREFASTKDVDIKPLPTFEQDDGLLTEMNLVDQL